MRHEDALTLVFLEGIGLAPARVLEVKEVHALDGVVTVEDEDEETHALGKSLARSIFVRSPA